MDGPSNTFNENGQGMIIIDRKTGKHTWIKPEYFEDWNNFTLDCLVNNVPLPDYFKWEKEMDLKKVLNKGTNWEIDKL